MKSSLLRLNQHLYRLRKKTNQPQTEQPFRQQWQPTKGGALLQSNVNARELQEFRRVIDPEYDRRDTETSFRS